LRRQLLQRRMKICTKVPTPCYAEEEWNFGGNDQKIKKMGKGAEFERNQICDTFTYISVRTVLVLFSEIQYSTWVRHSKKILVAIPCMCTRVRTYLHCTMVEEGANKTLDLLQLYREYRVQTARYKILDYT
jgi:hypothetical protein